MQSIPLVSASQSGDSLMTTTSLDTSTVRRQLSNLQFNSTSEPQNIRRQAKSASDIILFRNSSVDATNPAGFSPKPKVQRLRRRKQEFDRLLQTPPYDRQNAKGRTVVERQKSEADSGFGSCCESTNSAIESEIKSLMDNAVMGSQTPPHRIRVQSSVGDADERVESVIDDGDVDAEEDVNMMLFTPFKIVDGSTDLPELSPDIELSASIVAGSETWVPFTPVSAGARARTSTPCRLIETPSSDSRLKHPSDCHTDVRLSRLLSEFNDNDSCCVDGVMGCENVPMADLVSTGVLTLDEVFELDVTDLQFA